MKINKKRLLSYLAVIVVAGAAMAAYVSVLSKADAVTSLTDTIIVKVFDKYPKATITFPANEEIIVGPEHTMTYDWSNASSVEFILFNEAGKEIDRWIDEFGEFEPGEHPSDTGSHPIALENYGKYKLTAIANGPIGSSEDSVVFYRLSTSVSYIGSEENGDPRVNIKYDDGVKILRVWVYDSAGNVVSSEPDIVVTEGTDHIELILKMPVTAEAGEYKVVVEGLDSEKNPISDSSFTKFYYNPPIPVTPDSGRFLGNLNIARTDFLITGLIIFVAVAISALFLIYRKKEQ